MHCRFANPLICCLTWLGAATLALGDESAAKQARLDFFERKVRPLLVEKCYSCHSADAKQLKANLRLDFRSELLKGGDSGPALVPNDPDASLIMDAVRWRSLEMPPDSKLSDEQVAILERWIQQGAAWPAAPATDPVADDNTDLDWDAIRASHWAWQPIRKPNPPVGGSPRWSQNPIDRFVSRQHRRNAIIPNDSAAPHVLVRRIYLDLHGVVPSIAQVDRFVKTARRDRHLAVAKLTDELLSSPQYGERWARHWLDVARYSDGFGGVNDNAALPNAWRYRDWVVSALNRDMPYDRFVRLQISADSMGDHQHVAALGFFAVGPNYTTDGGDPDSDAQAKSENLDDRMDTLGRGLLGITLSCARCHDHKFDPIQQVDYYALAGVFNNTKFHQVALADPELVAAYDKFAKENGELSKQLKKLQKKPESERSDDEQSRITALRHQIGRLNADAPPGYATAHGLIDTGSSDMHVAIRGDIRKRGELVPRQFIKLLSHDKPKRFNEGSGRRQLAHTIASSDNPLFARVMANRVWQHHFGRGLVRSPSNFGTTGERPTHPDLLDWLATRFIEDGWSLKRLHRTIMLSETYQLSSAHNSAAFATDGDNAFLWRMSPRRMDVESYRDSVLSVTNELRYQLGGTPIDDLIGRRRRTLYAKTSRCGEQFPSDHFLRLFDFPLMRATIAKRSTSIVPQQYLFLLNSPFVMARASALTTRLEHRCGHDDRARIALAYKLLYGRTPLDREIETGLEYLDTRNITSETRRDRWERYAQVLLSSNEFMFVR